MITRILLSLLGSLCPVGGFVGVYELCRHTGGTSAEAIPAGIFGLMLGVIGIFVIIAVKEMLAEWWDWLWTDTKGR